MPGQGAKWHGHQADWSTGEEDKVSTEGSRGGPARGNDVTEDGKGNYCEILVSDGSIV